MSHETPLAAAHSEALRRIQEAKSSGAWWLDLGDLPIERLPDEIAELKELEVLALGRYKPFVDGTWLGWGFEVERPGTIKDLPALTGLSALTTLHLSWCRQLTSLEPLAGLSALTTLDLSGCGQLMSLEPLAGLSALTTLHLSRCGQLTSLPSLAGLSALTTLHLSRCGQLTSLPSLAGLNALTTLDLSWCKQLTSLPSLAGLSALTTLHLSWCKQLTSLPSLAGLNALTTLDLSWCKQLTSLPSLAGLNALTTLDLTFCEQLMSLPSLAGLNALTTLDLSWCKQLTSLPSLAGLNALTTLDLSGCGQLTSLPSLAGLNALTTLNLFECSELTSLPSLAGLNALTRLDLSRCAQLTSLEPLAGLSALTTLVLRGCWSEAFQPVCALLPQLTTLQVFDSQFPDLHPSVCGRDFGDDALDSVRAYFAALGPDARPDAEIKVFVLGNGRSGKTKLLGRLRGLAYHKVPEGSTHGISIEPWPVPDHWKLPHPVTLRLWDFGGQDIYHGTHALFLREPAIYLLLYSHATENEEPFEEGGFTMRNRPLPYWFDYLRQEAGQGGVVASPVLFLQSRCDEPPGPDRVPPFFPPQEQFPDLSPLTHLSAKEEDGLDALFPILKRAVKRLLREHPQPPLPVSWAAVRERLREMQAAKQPRTLSLAELSTICAECGCLGDEKVLRDALSLMGVIYYRPGVFDDRIIVDQSWALEAIYTLFQRNEEFQDEIEGKNGRFTRRQLERYFWKAAGHSLADQRTFLSFMEQCGICFRARPGDDPDYEGHYLIPDKLEPWGAFHDENYYRQLQDVTGREVTATFALLHDGIARAFLSKIGSVSGDHATFWRYGCHFREKNTAAEALVRCEGNVLRVRTWGERAGELAGKLVKVVQAVPCGQAPQIAWIDEADVPVIVDAPGSAPERALKMLPNPKSVFFSYRHPDPKVPGSERGRLLLRELRELLKPDGWKVQFDEDELQDGDSISRFMDVVRECNFLVPIFCERYLESRYTLSELFCFREKFAHDGKAFADRTITVTYPESGIQSDLRQADLAERCRTMFDEHFVRAGKKTLPPKIYNEVYWLNSWAQRLGEILADLSDRLNTPTAQAVADRLKRTYERLYPDRRDR